MPALLLSQEGGSAESQDKKNWHHHFIQSLFCGDADGCGATKHPDEQIQVNLFTAIPMPCKNQHCLCLPLGWTKSGSSKGDHFRGLLPKEKSICSVRCLGLSRWAWFQTGPSGEVKQCRILQWNSILLEPPEHFPHTFLASSRWKEVLLAAMLLAAPQEEVVSLPMAAAWVAEEQWHRLAMTRLCSAWFPVLFSPCWSKTWM